MKNRKGLQPLKYRYPKLLKDVLGTDINELNSYCKYELNLNVRTILNISKICIHSWPYSAPRPLYSIRCLVSHVNPKINEAYIYYSKSGYDGWDDINHSRFSDKNLEKL